ncbi:MAG TPA: MFS transporter [Elusimicrobiota bacterium]|nr:MFS transporter [Elusimicrobiota bacterium]
MTEQLRRHAAVLFRAFKSRNYRLFYAGQTVSLLGTWMQSVAVGWMAYRLSNSSLWLGLIGFASQLPSLLVMPFAGVLSDRLDRRRMLFITQTAFMLQATALAALYYAHALSLWYMVALSLLLGVINAFDIPIRQSFVVEIIDDKEDIGNAIALNSSMVNGSRLVGPALAGFLIAWYDEGICFLVNAVSFVAVMISLILMRVRPIQGRTDGQSVWQGLRDGVRYVFGHKSMRYIIFLLALASFVGMPYTVLLPIFARDVLGGGPHTLGILMGASGLGALAGSLFLASRKGTTHWARIIFVAAMIFGMMLIAFSWSRRFWVSILLIVGAGFGMMVHMAMSNTVLQSLSDDEMRGRVISFYAMAFIGMTPFGSLLGGFLSDLWGASLTLTFAGVLCLVGAVLFRSKMKVLGECR